MSSEQEQIKDSQKWHIPQGCGLEKLMTMLIAIRNKNGDREYIEDEKFQSAIDLSKSLFSPNIVFFNSIKLLERGGKKIKLTKIGSELTEAWVRNDENISKLIQQIIKESHLIDLHDYIQTNHGIKTAKIFSFIKAQARIPDAKDGRPFADIPFQGVKTVIKLFEKANLLTNEQIEEFKDYKNTNSNGSVIKKLKIKNEKKISVVNKPNIAPNSSGHLSLTSGIEIQLNSNKNIKFAIMQLNDLLGELDNEAIDVDSEVDSEMKRESVDVESNSET